MDTSHVDMLRLIGRDTRLKWKATTDGGQYAGPCPWCGGKDRFQVWPNASTPHYWCSQCKRHGDAITYLRERYGVSFEEACRQLNLSDGDMKQARRPSAQRLKPASGLVRNDWLAFTDEGWQPAARDFTRRAFDLLHSSEGHRAMGYLLQQRGLTERVIEQFGLGYNPNNQNQRWGQTKVFLPAGIVIPWSEGQDVWSPTAQLWAVNIRQRLNETPKYWKVKGSANGLYGVAYLTRDAPVVMVEGEFCALSIHTAVPDLFVPLATGSTTGSHHDRWIARLALASRVILAFDDDDNQAGEKATDWWKDAFPDKAIRLVPTRHDVNDMLTAGDDIRAWLSAALSQPAAST
jgi:DNA primase